MKKLSTTQLAMSYTGIFLGAGFVSGQELWQFFACFGPVGLIGFIGTAALFFYVNYANLRLIQLTGQDDMWRSSEAARRRKRHAKPAAGRRMHNHDSRRIYAYPSAFAHTRMVGRAYFHGYSRSGGPARHAGVGCCVFAACSRYHGNGRAACRMGAYKKRLQLCARKRQRIRIDAELDNRLRYLCGI